MGIDLNDKLVETATKIAVTTDEYGDTKFGATSQSPCLYRDISSLRQNNNMIEVSIDGILWFGPDEDVHKQDIYYHPDEGYLQISRITKAKRLLLDNSVQFIRCEVTRTRQIS